MAYPDVGNTTGWNYDVVTELQPIAHYSSPFKDTLKVTDTHPGQFRDLVIGEGHVNFHSIFTALKDMDYCSFSH